MKKILISMLALLLAMGGAWAQGPTAVFEVDFSSTPTATTGSMLIGSTVAPASVLIHNNTDLINTIKLTSPYDYTANRYVSIKPETGSFQTGDTLLIAVCYYSFSTNTQTATADIYAANGTTKLFTTAPGINGRTESGDPVVEKFVLEQDADSLLIGGSSTATATDVTTLKVLRPAAQPIKLTPDATGKVWTLAETPDYNLDLNVVYYQKFALKEIPANWQVMVDGLDKTAAIDHDSLKISETAQVILTPDHPERVKKVILVDEAVLVNIDGITLDITGCTTWAQIIARNPGVLEDNDGEVAASGRGVLDLGGNIVSTSAPYNPAQQSNYRWVLI